MKIAKYLALVGVVAIALVAIFLRFSGEESRFECHGKLSSHQAKKPAIVYIKFLAYRRWIRPWSDSEAALWVEMPDEYTVDSFGHVSETQGGSFEIYDSKRSIKGLFLNVDRTLRLSTSRGTFDGVCKRIVA